MRLLRLLLPAFAALVCAQDEAVTVPFQSDISRLMSVVVSHLYHHKDVFLRELTSNAGDAISKTRILALTDPSILDAAPALNISIRPHKESRTLVITDSGVGMTREELQKNLGTIARSGTSEFLTKMESGGEKSSNLIGQFGLGMLYVAARTTADHTARLLLQLSGSGPSRSCFQVEERRHAMGL